MVVKKVLVKLNDDERQNINDRIQTFEDTCFGDLSEKSRRGKNLMLNR